MARRFVNGHVEDSKVELAEVEEGAVDVLGADEFSDKVVWDFLRGWGFCRGMGGILITPGSEIGG